MLEAVAGKALMASGVAAAKGATTVMVRIFVEKVVEPFFGAQKAKAALLKAAKTYYRNMESRTRHVPTIAVQGGKFCLEDVYEPLELVNEQDGSLVRVVDYPDDIFDAGRCILIVDSAGMGKSTVSKFVFRCALRELRKIPILIELRRIKEGSSLKDLIISDFLGASNKEPVREGFLEALLEGNFLILLDGFDELAPEVKSGVAEEICQISSDLQYCNFVLTSRPEPALASFSSYVRYDISDLTKDEAFSLLRRYDAGRGVADDLISKVKSISSVDELLKAPLLVTLLYKAYDYKAVIPLKRNIFYRQVFDALYQDHDLSKEGAFERRKKSSMDLDDFHRFMRCLGFLTFVKGVVQYSQESFSYLIEDAVRRSGVKADIAGIKSDLTSAVPLFVREGNDFRWSHKSFQDYFSAQFIYYDSGIERDETIRKMFWGDSILRYWILLELICELDRSLFGELCVLPFIDKFIPASSSRSDDVQVQADLLGRISRSFVVRVEGVKGLEAHEVFDKIEEIIGEEEVFERFSQKSYFGLKDDDVLLYSMSSVDADRWNFVSRMYRSKGGYKRAPMPSLLKQFGSDDALCCDLNEISIASDDFDLRRSAVSLIQYSLNFTSIPTRELIEEVRRDVSERIDSRKSFSVLESIV